MIYFLSAFLKISNIFHTETNQLRFMYFISGTYADILYRGLKLKQTTNVRFIHVPTDKHRVIYFNLNFSRYVKKWTTPTTNYKNIINNNTFEKKNLLQHLYIKMKVTYTLAIYAQLIAEQVYYWCPFLVKISDENNGFWHTIFSKPF